MPKKSTIEKAKRDLRQGKSPSTAAGEFIREEMDRLHEGDKGVRSQKQAVAIGLSMARRAGVPLKPQGETAEQARTRRSVERAHAAGKKKKRSSPARKNA